MGKPLHPEDEETNVRLIAPGFWKDDLEQIAALAHLSGRYGVPYMRRQALYLGTMTLSASLPPGRFTRRRGLYKDEELAAALQSVLAAPVQFCERVGVSIISPPAAVINLAKAITAPQPTWDAVSPEQVLSTFRVREQTIPTGKGDEGKGQYWIEDLKQLEALAEQHGREHAAFLRRVAFHTGVLLLSASRPIGGPFGRYQTAEEVAAALSPLLATAVLFVQQQGYEILPIPRFASEMLGLMERMLSRATSFQPGALSQEVSERHEEVQATESSSATPATGKRAVLSRSRRKNLGLDEGDL